jgi:phage protein D
MPDRQRDAVVPAFQILVNGSVIPPEAATDLFLLEVSDSVDEIGMFTISLNAGDPRSGRVKWVDTDLFREGSEVVVKMGVQPPLTELMNGEITGLEPEFPAQGPIQLVVRGYDRLHRLRHGRKTRSFRNVKDSDIASQIAGDWKLTAEVEATSVTHEYVFQNNQTDLEFLLERARRIRYEVRCSGRKLVFRKPAERAGATATLNFGQEMVSFAARLSLMSQIDAVRVQGWSTRDKKEILGKAESGDELKVGGRDTGVALVKRVVGGEPVVAVIDPPESAEDAEVMAHAGLNAHAFDFVTGEGTCIGNGLVKAGAVVELRELGTRFSGPYYVTASTHSVSTRKGYTTHFSVRRSAA